MTFLKIRSYFIWKSEKIFETISNFKPQVRYAKTDTEKCLKDEKMGDIFLLSSSKRKKLFSKPLSIEFVQNLKSVTTVSVASNYVTWSKILLPSFELVNWEYEALPDFTSTEILEKNLLKAAFAVKEKLPDSDLYLMEAQFPKYSQNTIGTALRYMLIMLLTTLNNGNLENSKLILQRPFILNTLMQLTVGGERISAKKIIFKAFGKGSLKDLPLPHDQSVDNLKDAFLLLKIKREELYSFSTLSEIKQESLALALLLNLGFLNVVYLQNPKAIALLREKYEKRPVK